MELEYDVCAASLNKAGERQCGDISQIEWLDGGVSVLLADGVGSGFTASLHAGMTAKLIMSMMRRGEDIKDIIDTVAGNMENNSSREIDYCAFTLMFAMGDGMLVAAIFNMPEPVLLRRGKQVALKISKLESGRKHIKMLRIQLLPYDTVAIFSDGVTKAGIGGSLNLGFGQKSAVSYLQAAYKPHISSEKLVKLLLAVCNSLYLEKPGDDVTAIVIRAQSGKLALSQHSKL